MGAWLSGLAIGLGMWVAYLAAKFATGLLAGVLGLSEGDRIAMSLMAGIALLAAAVADAFGHRKEGA